MHEMPRPQVLSRIEAECSEHFGETVNRLFVITRDVDGLVGRIEAGHQILILSRHTNRAMIAVAFQSLDAADRHHHGAGTHDDVGTDGQSLQHCEARRDFSARENPDLAPQRISDERVVNEDQSFNQRRTDMV